MVWALLLGNEIRSKVGMSCFGHRARKRLEGVEAGLAEAGVGLADREFYSGGSALLKGREMTEAILKRSDDRVWIGVATRDVYFCLVESRQQGRVVAKTYVGTDLGIECHGEVDGQRRHAAGDRTAGISDHREVSARVDGLSIGDGQHVRDRSSNRV